MPDQPITIRPAVPADADRLADLADQLGYPTDPQGIPARLDKLAAAGHDLYVAEGGEGTIAGWVEVYLHESLVGEKQATLGGLVVDESYRSQGVGAALLDAAEDWGRAHGAVSLRVQSNVIRERAHRFYQRQGYTITKRQVILIKPL